MKNNYMLALMSNDEMIKYFNKLSYCISKIEVEIEINYKITDDINITIKIKGNEFDIFNLNNYISYDYSQYSNTCLRLLEEHNYNITHNYTNGYNVYNFSSKLTPDYKLYNLPTTFNKSIDVFIRDRLSVQIDILKRLSRILLDFPDIDKIFNEALLNMMMYENELSECRLNTFSVVYNNSVNLLREVKKGNDIFIVNDIEVIQNLLDQLDKLKIKKYYIIQKNISIKEGTYE